MATFTHTPRSYSEAREAFRNAARRPRGGGLPYIRLGYVTELHALGTMLTGADPDDAPAYAVYQHNTAIVTFYRNGVVALDHGGWLSRTTVDRWGEFTPDDVRVNGVDILARRDDRDPRFIVSRRTGETTTHDGPWGGEPYQRHVYAELATSRHADGPLYIVKCHSRATDRDVWTIAPRGFVRDALDSTTTRRKVTA